MDIQQCCKEVVEWVQKFILNKGSKQQGKDEKQSKQSSFTTTRGTNTSAIMAAVNFSLHNSPFCEFGTVNPKQFGAAVLTNKGRVGNENSSWNGADAAFLDGLFFPTKTTLGCQKSDLSIPCYWLWWSFLFIL